MCGQPVARLQAISQGLYALAKLEHHPGEDVLHALAHILPLRITQKVVDRQAIGNSMWALATLGYKPSNLLFKQLMQLVMQHCGNFLSYHYSQARTSVTSVNTLESRPK